MFIIARFFSVASYDSCRPFIRWCNVSGRRKGKRWENGGMAMADEKRPRVMQKQALMTNYTRFHNETSTDSLLFRMSGGTEDSIPSDQRAWETRTAWTQTTRQRCSGQGPGQRQTADGMDMGPVWVFYGKLCAGDWITGARNLALRSEIKKGKCHIPRKSVDCKPWTRWLLNLWKWQLLRQKGPWLVPWHVWWNKQDGALTR